MAHKFELGDRVAFVAQEHDAFAGQRITGEVVKILSDDSIVVYRDEPWRYADAIATRLPVEDAEPE